MYESHHDFGLNVLKRYEERVSVYNTASKNVATQVATIARLEAVPKTLVGAFIPNILTGLSDADRAKRLSEMYFQLEKLQEAADKSGSLLNFADSQLIEELSFFHRRRADDVINNLKTYARRQLDGERTVHDAVQNAVEALDESLRKNIRQSIAMVDNQDNLVARQDEPKVSEEDEDIEFTSGLATPFAVDQ